MWPFGRKYVASRLAGARGGATSVSVLTTVVSPSTVESPLTGARGAIVHIELLELLAPGGAYVPIGVVVLGDLVTLRDEDLDEISLVARRARIHPAAPPTGATVLESVPPELAPLLAKARGRGPLCYREVTLATNDRVVLTAVIEPSRSVVAAGYRSGTRTTYVARDDLEPVILDEVTASASW